jgi:hypothetical protein
MAVQCHAKEPIALRVFDDVYVRLVQHMVRGIEGDYSSHSRREHTGESARARA